MCTSRDHGHHHPVVRKQARRWVWSCGCGGCSPRLADRAGAAADWHATVVAALLHSAIAA